MKAEIKLEKQEIIKAIEMYVRRSIPGVCITDIDIASYSSVSAPVRIDESCAICEDPLAMPEEAE